MSLNRLKLPLYFNTKRHQNKWIVLKQSLKVSRTDWHTYRHIQYTSFAQFLYNTVEIYPAAFCTKWPIKLNFSPLWRWPLSLPQSHSSFSSWGKKQMTSSHYNPIAAPPSPLSHRPPISLHFFKTFICAPLLTSLICFCLSSCGVVM